MQDALRDIPIHAERSGKLRLKVTLATDEKSYAISTYGSSDRILRSITANIYLEDGDHNVIISNKCITVSTSYNISHLHGEVSLAVYGQNNEQALKELSRKIVETIKVVLNSAQPISEPQKNAHGEYPEQGLQQQEL
jgi:hypothetical protein